MTFRSYVAYVIADSAHREGVRSVVEDRRRIDPDGTKYNILSVDDANTLLTRLAGDPAEAATFEFVLVAKQPMRTYSKEFRVRCSSIAASMSFAQPTTICDTIFKTRRPKSRAELVAESRIWYDKLVDHAHRADGRPLVLAGRSGVGKSCMMQLVADQCKVQLHHASADDIDGEKFVDEETLYLGMLGEIDKALAAPNHATLLLVLDDADNGELHAKPLIEFLQLIQQRYTQRLAFVLVLNDWYAQTAGIMTLRKRNLIKAKTHLVRCEPLPTAPSIAAHLRRVFFKNATAAVPERLLYTIASEAGGNVCMAMVRLDFALRATPKLSTLDGTTLACSAVNEETTQSAAEQIQMAAYDIRALLERKRDATPPQRRKMLPESANLYALVERRFNTLDDAETAESLLHTNIDNLLPPMPYVVACPTRFATDQQVRAKRRELAQSLELLKSHALLTELQSDADLVRTHEKESGYAGSDLGVPLMLGVACPLSIVARRQRAKSYMRMEFPYTNAVTRARENGASVETIAKIVRLSAALRNDGIERLESNIDDDTVYPLARFASSVPIDDIELVCAIGGPSKSAHLKRSEEPNARTGTYDVIANAAVQKEDELQRNAGAAAASYYGLTRAEHGAAVQYAESFGKMRSLAQFDGSDGEWRASIGKQWTAGTLTTAKKRYKDSEVATPMDRFDGEQQAKRPKHAAAAAAAATETKKK